MKESLRIENPIGGNEAGRNYDKSEKSLDEIVFPKNNQESGIPKALFDKLNDYENRIKEAENDAPEILAEKFYKKEILQQLIYEGAVKKAVIRDLLERKYGNLREDIFENAFDVIRDYAETGGEKTIGGTGLDIEEITPENTVLTAKNFEELYDVLKEKDGIQGSEDYFESEQLISIIEKVRAGEFGLEYVTRTNGLRNKVKELLAIDEQRNKINNL